MYLTATSLKDYLLCPFKFKLSHIEKLRRIPPKGILAFGTVVHASIAKFFLEKVHPMNTFFSLWKEEEETEYEFSNGDNHSTLMEQGCKLLSEWHEHPETKILVLHAVEKQRYVEIANRVPFWSTIDFTGDEGKILLDWKTAIGKYPEHKARLDLQLTAYAYVLAETERTPDRVGFGVLVKKKVPEIQYIFSYRTAEDLKNFERLVLKVFEEIEREEFLKIPGMHCAWCDFVGICTGEITEEEIPQKFVSYPERYSDPDF
ncbi:PD-(D/E)XK nuclease family protein [Thermodesulfovibrio yellowstonii]|uniref:PD-(D/E)XK nuclease family protein n=1 Tax=Thermodesulfovibrio yellowstonii TaxID=28262 RepID=UPI00040B40CB|nr:PD-(D/E)XK nuclease family protein [Thermodesulfovibrio islandicus]